MGHWQKCPKCGGDSQKVSYEAGYEAAMRDFWRGVCEQKAVKAEETASLNERQWRYARSLDPEGTSGWGCLERANKWRAHAARLRAWAREGA